MKSFQKTVLLIISILITISCSAPKKEEAPVPVPLPVTDMKNCVCVQLWMPVCGENGKTYSNACFAKCANVKFKIGPCDQKI